MLRGGQRQGGGQRGPDVVRRQGELVRAGQHQWVTKGKRDDATGPGLSHDATAPVHPLSWSSCCLVGVSAVRGVLT